MLRVENVHFNLGGTTLLRGIDLQLLSGQILAIVGPNGAGKTTLLNALLGDVSVSSGSIAFMDRSVRDWPLAERAKHIAVLPQLNLLNFPYTVAEVVALGRTPHSSGIEVDQQIVQSAMAAMGIEHLRERLYTELSGGEKQRTQLARVMAQIWRREDADSRLLILDEPTNSLDLGHKQQLMQAVHNFALQGVAVIMVEHDISLAANYSHWMLALQKGRSVAYGPCAEVFNEGLVRQLFGASVRVWHDSESGKKGISV